VLAWLFAATVVPAAQAQDLTDRVTTETLDNGMRILLVRQDSAPVVSFHLAFDVGGIDEPLGLGGIAHMVEHMAFKGTSTLGTTDAEAEARALDAVEVAVLALEAAERSGDAEAIAAAQARFEAARAAANALASPAPLDDLLSVAGAVGLNASTGYDSTQYVVSLPANRVELYARIYADVLADTVFRSFYEERDVVREERRQRSQDDPQGVLIEAFLAEAFPQHPYGRPLIGSFEEIADWTATRAEAFYRAFYAPHRALLVAVGDVDPERDLPVLRRYFGAVPDRETVRVRIPDAAPQTAERRVEVTFDAQPQLAVGWRKPTWPQRDAYVLDLIDALLTNGRTSRLYQRLVLQDGSVLGVSSASSFPGTREDNLFLVYAQPRAPFGPDDVLAAVDDEIRRLIEEGVSEDELDKVRNQVRASTVFGLTSNAGLASALAFNELFAGGWERLFADLDVYLSIDAEEIRAVAARTFTDDQRTIAVLLPPGAEGEVE
jgi:predicted Zn-dependent peptidase